MRPKMKLLKLQEERDAPPTQGRNTQWRVKKTRKLGHTDRKAKKRTMQRRMRSKANTRQRKGINLKAAVKAERRVGGRKAKRKVTNTKLTTEDIAQGAKTEMPAKKKKSQNQITIKTEIRVVSPIKSRKKMPKEEIVREPEQSHEAKKEPQKRGTDLVAGTGIGVDLQNQKTKMKNEKKTETGAKNVAGARKGDTTVTGRIRGEEPQGIRNTEQEVQIGTSPETLTEAGDLEARVVRETTAKISLLIERTKTEKLLTKGKDVAAAAAALTGTEVRKGRGKRAQIPDGAEVIVPPDPKTEEAQQS